MWPIHLHFQEGESIFSWLIRMAMAMGTRPHLLCRSFVKSRLNRVSDFDIEITTEEFRIASALTGIHLKQFEKASLKDYHKLFFKNSRQKITWLTSSISLPPTKRLATVCPLCMANESIPHLKKDWRLTFITVCPTHAVRLIDKCPQCNHFFYADQTLFKMANKKRCESCGFKFEKMSTPCTNEIYYSNKFFTDIDMDPLAWRAFYLLGRLVGEGSLYRPKFGEDTVANRHMILKRAFLEYELLCNDRREKNDGL